MNLKDILLILKKRIYKNKNIEEFESDLENKNLIDEILDKATSDFFPKNGKWYNNCFKKSKELEMRNLPCNLRNGEWLAMMLQEEQKLYYISLNRIFKYVTTSKFFEEKRHEYELGIVKWQINWMKNDGENWVCRNEYGGDCGIFMLTCDLWFRKGIVDTLSAIGMNLEVIEEGIEKNADLWRGIYMRHAFTNTFEPAVYFLSENENIPPTDEKHQQLWLKMRRYQYYQSHKESVDKYGVVSEDMLMTQEEVEKLEKELEIMNEERMNILTQNKGRQKLIVK